MEAVSTSPSMAEPYLVHLAHGSKVSRRSNSLSGTLVRRADTSESHDKVCHSRLTSTSLVAQTSNSGTGKSTEISWSGDQHTISFASSTARRRWADNPVLDVPVDGTVSRTNEYGDFEKLL